MPQTSGNLGFYSEILMLAIQLRLIMVVSCPANLFLCVSSGWVRDNDNALFLIFLIAVVFL